MAIEFSAGFEGKTLAQIASALHADEAMIPAVTLDGAGAKLVPQLTGVGIVLGGKLIAMSTVKPQAFKLALSGSLGSLSVSSVATQIVALYQKALAVLVELESAAKAPDDVLVVPVKPAKAKALKMKKVQTESEVSTEVSNVVVKLSDATALGQPVHGTGGGSVYHCIAISDGVKVAARIRQDMTVSFRVEGHGVPAISAKLAEAGLSKGGEGHYSLHLKPETWEMVRKSVGALLFAVGVRFKQVKTNVTALIGKGV